MCVNDIDLACSERNFRRLGRALTCHGITHVVKPWHVLQAHRYTLKVEFDSAEYWMADLPAEYELVVMSGCTFRVVSLPYLRRLYQRGLEATADGHDEADRAKHASMVEKYHALCLMS